MRSLYSILNQNAKLWWVNLDLRKQGNHKAARIREREAIKSRVNDLRLAKKVGAYAVIGNYYPSLNYAEYKTSPTSSTKQTISGLDKDYLRSICTKLNIPVIELENASGKAYNKLMDIKSDLSNLSEIMQQIETIKRG